MDKKQLIQKIQNNDALSSEEKAYIANILHTSKKYGLVWEDKPEAIEEILRSQLPVLSEVKDKRILAKNLAPQQQEETTKKTKSTQIPLLQEEAKPKTTEEPNKEIPNHILIEGDNLHALTTLSFTHKGKIDVIYIDPPYNTGNKDFKYNDRFIDKEDSYRHSKWLSFMQKRLKIAHSLLADTGVIFISIDDNEQAALKLLCDEIFGEGNFISDIIWQSRKSVSNDTFISLNHNYTLFYSKNISALDKNNFRLPISEEKFENRDNDPRGRWVADPFDAPNIRPNLTYVIVNPNTKEEFLPPKGRCWRTTQEEYLKLLSDNRIIFGRSGKTKPQLKRFLSFAKDKGSTTISIWNDTETTTNGTQQLEKIFGNKKFTNPKPLGLLDRILKLSSQKSSTILDFFAGSGTTMHAVMELNKEDGGNRQCILVTNNENNICEEVTYIRNQKVIEGYTNAKGEEVQGLSGNNLRYYQCGYVGSSHTEQNRRLLTARSTDLLCIKEDCYTECGEDAGFESSECRIFHDEQGKYLVVVYYSRNIPNLVPVLVSHLQSLEISQKVRLYAFSPSTETLEDEFWEIADKIEALPLPETLYNAYRATFKELSLDSKEPQTIEEEEEEGNTQQNLNL
jgi:adenine-specific DNA-methyltransferase